ncbi:signal peptidase II [Clostridium sp.]|uniref:signal peptidase II n=1 Tax=Clostridium sp. TaxID=1506 RepID=UPI002610D27D|nr:signal peptidase II [Clostridium sp.]
MNNRFNKDKILTISILPLMWLIYFVFEIVTGRVKDIYTFITNLSLVLLFALAGYIIYIVSKNYSSGFHRKVVFKIFLILMIIDQGIKIIINRFFFNDFYELIRDFLYFDPIINTKGSWLNARFNFGVGFITLIIINIIALFLFLEVYRYYLSKNPKSFWVDSSFIFLTAGGLCSLIDKVFYGGSLDFIGISNLFIADIKDIYINIGLLFFIMFIYKAGYLNEDDTSLKEDIKSIKSFFIFIKKDLFKK